MMPTDKQSAERARALAWLEANGREPSLSSMAEFAALAVQREREACAKAVCDACDAVENLTNGQHCTEDSDGNKYYFECKAAAIWARDAERG